MRRTLQGRSTALFAAAVLLAQGSVGHAEDAEGNFSVRGAGLINCALFVEAREKRDDAYLVTAAWIDGYVTGINQHADDTYDLLSFETTELLMIVIDQHCRDHPGDPLFGVLDSLFDDLRPDRLTERSEKVTLVVDGREVQHYVELVSRLQQALKDAGVFDGAVDGQFGPATIEAIERYQATAGMSPTGFPDQSTLWRLLRNE